MCILTQWYVCMPWNVTRAYGICDVCIWIHEYMNGLVINMLRNRGCGKGCAKHLFCTPCFHVTCLTNAHFIQTTWDASILNWHTTTSQSHGKPASLHVRLSLEGASKAGRCLWGWRAPQGLEGASEAGRRLWGWRAPQGLEGASEAGRCLWGWRAPQGLEGASEAGRCLWGWRAPQGLEGASEAGRRLWSWRTPQRLEGAKRQKGTSVSEERLRGYRAEVPNLFRCIPPFCRLEALIPSPQQQYRIKNHAVSVDIISRL